MKAYENIIWALTNVSDNSDLLIKELVKKLRVMDVISNFIMIVEGIDVSFYSIMKTFLKNMRFDFD